MVANIESADLFIFLQLERTSPITLVISSPLWKCLWHGLREESCLWSSLTLEIVLQLKQLVSCIWHFRSPLPTNYILIGSVICLKDHQHCYSNSPTVQTFAEDINTKLRLVLSFLQYVASHHFVAWIWNLEKCITRTGSLAHNVCAQHDARLNWAPRLCKWCVYSLCSRAPI